MEALWFTDREIETCSKTGGGPLGVHSEQLAQSTNQVELVEVEADDRETYYVGRLYS